MDTKALDLVTKRHSPFCNCAANPSAGTVCNCLTDEAAAELKTITTDLADSTAQLVLDECEIQQLRTALDEAKTRINNLCSYLGKLTVSDHERDARQSFPICHALLEDNRIWLNEHNGKEVTK
jgi:hypothetical protein